MACGLPFMPALLHAATSALLSQLTRYPRPTLNFLHASESTLDPQTLLPTHQNSALLFHKDFKRHMEGADLLADASAADPEAALASLDLALRWLTLRQQDANTNTQCLLKLIELCRSLLYLLAQHGGQLTEYEAGVLLPCLAEKSGHNQVRARALLCCWWACAARRL